MPDTRVSQLKATLCLLSESIRQYPRLYRGIRLSRSCIVSFGRRNAWRVDISIGIGATLLPRALSLRRKCPRCPTIGKNIVDKFAATAACATQHALFPQTDACAPDDAAKNQQKQRAQYEGSSCHLARAKLIAVWEVVRAIRITILKG